MTRTCLLACLFMLALLSVFDAAARPLQPTAVAGHLAIPEEPRQPVALDGQWGFAWHAFLDPHWQALPGSSFAPVPASWNELPADGKPAGPDGWGTYFLQVDCPPGQSMAVEAVGQRTAARLFINGTLVAAHGEPGPTREQSWPAVYNRVPITREFACPLRLTLHVSNFDHRAGGFVRSMFASPVEVLQQSRESRVIDHAALLTAYLLTGLVALIFYAVRRRERLPLVFGLFCVAIAIYTDMIGERLFLRVLPPQVGWIGYMRVEYLSWITAMVLFLLTLRGLFPQDVNRRAIQAVLVVLGLGAVAVFTLRPEAYSYMAVPGQAAAVVVGLYLTATMVRAARRERGDALVLLAGMLAVVIAEILDFVLIDTVGPGRKFAPIGFALFLMSPAVVIARRMSHALNAEERSRTLEENARLREDVERMSRHDLKTPLNGILGATRLLLDDRKIAGEQRELVQVLQRAGLRMLDMVNLSLGLFRMETGSYHFQPETVDLREVVQRVLLDLHPYAEALGVTVDWRGSDPAPAYVRGEEPLCYSIIANLVKNAVEAAGRGHEVAVDLQRGDAVTVTIHNPGLVPPAIAARFFEKYATSGKSGGTGLGTYSARLMARAQQGDVQMRTDAVDGTTLTVTLPMASADALPQQRPAGEDESLPAWLEQAPRRDVLLVDDDEFTRAVTRRLLPDPPFAVRTAVNGAAACEAMAQAWPDYLLLDMEMPLQGGVETVHWVRQQEAAQGRPRCRIVMVSGNDDPVSIAEALQAGADRFLAKPVRRELLLATLHELQAGSMPAAPHVLAVEPEWLKVFPKFLEQQRETLRAMEEAVREGDRGQLRYFAHRAFGGLATMGLHWAAGECRHLEQHAIHGTLDQLAARIASVREHLASVQLTSQSLAHQ